MKITSGTTANLYGGTLVQMLKSHKVCGTVDECTHLGPAHTELVKWTKLGTTTDLSGGGSYYLASPLTTNLTIPAGQTVNLCLYGHTLTGTVTVAGTLNLCDCTSGGGIKNTASGGAAIVIQDGGTVNQYGGKLSAPETPVQMEAEGIWNFYGGSATTTKTDGSTAKIEPTGTVNLQGGETGTTVIEFTADSKPVNIGGEAPEGGYKMKENGGTIDVTLPDGADTGAYVKDEQGNPLPVGGGTTPGTAVTVDGIGVLEADPATGKLTEAQLGEPQEKPGYVWDGYYTQPDGAGDKVTTDTEFSEETTIYPHWTLCTHKDENGKPTAENGVSGPSATCTTAGSESFTCSQCGLAVTQDIPALGHKVPDGAAWQTGMENTGRYALSATGAPARASTPGTRAG